MVQNQLNQGFGDSKVTLLHMASKEGHAKMIQLLLENGADPVIKDKAKKTAYSYCPDKPSRTAFRKFQVSLILNAYAKLFKTRLIVALRALNSPMV